MAKLSQERTRGFIFPIKWPSKMKYSFFLYTSACLFMFSNAYAEDANTSRCKESETKLVNLMFVFETSGSGEGWNSNGAGIHANIALNKLLPTLHSRLPIVFGCNGISARFPSTDAMQNLPKIDEYILTSKPISAYTSSRVGSTVTIDLNLLSPPPRKLVWHSLFTFPPVLFGIFKSSDEESKIQTDRLSNFLLDSFVVNRVYDPKNALVDFDGKQIKSRSGVPKTGYAELTNVDAVPYLTERGRSEYQSYLYKKLPRAFAIAPNGSFGWSSGYDDAADRALDLCNKKGDNMCRLYSVNDKVVWMNEADAKPASKNLQGESVSP